MDAPNPLGRNISIVAGAVLILALGVLAYYRSSVLGPSSGALPEPTTPEQKAQVLQQYGAPVTSPQPQTASSSAEVSARAQILQSAQTTKKQQTPALSPSEQEKANILQSAGAH